jgi:hypothetical protein
VVGLAAAPFWPRPPRPQWLLVWHWLVLRRRPAAVVQAAGLAETLEDAAEDGSGSDGGAQMTDLDSLLEAHPA